MSRAAQTSLLGYLGENQPDLERRKFLKGLGLPTSTIELPRDGGSLINMSGKLLAVPPPPRTRITPSGNTRNNEVQTWMQHVKGDGAKEGTNGLGQGGHSIITPLIWIPGVLKSQGAWTTAMRESIHGPVLAVQPGVTLIKSDFLSNVVHGPTPEMVIQQKDQLIQELERSLAKQKLMNDKIIHKSKKHGMQALKMLEQASKEERQRNETLRAESVDVLKSRVKELRGELRTTNKASSSRLQRGYAMDNFLSQYSKIMTTVHEKAKAIAEVDHASLKNQVSALKRNLIRDKVYKKALKTRTEIAEEAAEKRWSEAESKIPQLELLINDQHARAAQLKMFNRERNHRTRREMESLNSQLRREQDARMAAEQHSQVLQKKLERSHTSLPPKFSSPKKNILSGSPPSSHPPRFTLSSPQPST